MNSFSWISLGFMLLTASHLSFSQQSEKTSPLAGAERLINNGEYETAIGTLEQHLKLQPEDGQALRLVARAYYWSGNTRLAEARYEKAFRLSQDNSQIRLEFGRFLVETSRYDMAEEVLSPLLKRDGVVAEASALLGTAAYWQGDWATGAELFTETLRIRPDHADAHRQLMEIRTATAPFLSLAPEYQTDSQPVRRIGGSGQLTYHIIPLLPVSLRAGSSRASVNDATRRVVEADLSVRQLWAKQGFGIDAGAGLVRQVEISRTEWKYRIGLSLHLPRSIQIRAQAERSPYWETSASFSIPVTTTTYSFIIDRPESEQWIGQARYTNTRYSDNNNGHNLYLWVLFPLNSDHRIRLRGGYAFSYQNTTSDRYALVSLQSLAGAYTPYYTPLDVQSHSAVGLIETRITGGLRLQVNGSYGVVASEKAPSFRLKLSGPGPPVSTIVKQFPERTFSPWQMQAALHVPVTHSLDMRLEGSKMETAYFRVTLLKLHLTYKFLPGVL